MGTHFRAAIGLPPPLHLEEKPSMALNVQASFQAMKAAATQDSSKKEDDSGSIFYINTQPSIPEAPEKLAKLQSANEFTLSFLSQKATEAADLKTTEKQLPQGVDEATRKKRANYRIRVIEYALQHSSWMSSQAELHASKTFTVAKDQLHIQIIRTVLSGLGLSPESQSKFEQVLQSISNGLKETQKHEDDEQKWVSITTYRYDPVQNKVFAGIRTIYFSVTQSLVEYNKSKNVKGFNASLVLNYQQSDYNFNESVWDGMAADVKAFVEKKDFITNIVNLAV